MHAARHNEDGGGEGRSARLTVAGSAGSVTRARPGSCERRSVSRIQIEAATKRFGAVTAVDDITLDIAHSEFLVLLGPRSSQTPRRARTAQAGRGADGELLAAPPVLG